jgi:hypothetical protein
MGMIRNQKATKNGDSHRTSPWLYRALDCEFRFTMDPCPFNIDFDPAKDEDGLLTDWDGHTVYCNPPYSGDNILKFVQKALASKCTTVLLLPSRTDTPWFRLLLDAHVELRYFRKRVNFINAEGKPHHPPENSILVVVRN